MVAESKKMPPLANKIPSESVYETISPSLIDQSTMKLEAEILAVLPTLWLFFHQNGDFLEINPSELAILFFPSKSGKNHFDLVVN